MSIPDKGEGAPFEIIETNVDDGYVTISFRRDIAGSVAICLKNVSDQCRRRNVLFCLGGMMETITRVMFGLQPVSDIAGVEGMVTVVDGMEIECGKPEKSEEAA